MRQLMIVLGTCLLVAGLAGAEEGHGPKPSEDPRFEFLKSLAGTWDSEMGPVEFRVTAGGHAVEEREFAGTPKEMVTLYYMEGGTLRATHYCMLGNRPQLVAAPRVVDGGLTFRCDPATGGPCTSGETHVDGWKMALGDDGRLALDVRILEEGKLVQNPNIVLTRR